MSEVKEINKSSLLTPWHGILPGHWKSSQINKLITLSQYGLSIATNTEGTIPILGMKYIADGKILLDDIEEFSRVLISEEDVEKFRLKNGDILLNRTNSYELVGKVGLFSTDELIVFASYLVRFQFDTNKVCPQFVNYCLNTAKSQKFLKRIATRGVSQVNINPTSFKKLFPLPVPPLKEQEKIAEVLEVWDDAITTTEKLITVKQKLRRGLLQKIFNQGKVEANIGQIKNGKQWKKSQLSEKFIRITRKNDNDVDLALTISGAEGLIRQEDFFKKRVASKSLSGYYLLLKGEFAFNRSSMKGYPFGAIKRLDRYESGAVSTLYICFAMKDGSEGNPDFYQYFFESGLFNREIYAIAQEGARTHGLLNVNVKDFFNLYIYAPNSEEQSRIVDILSCIDDEISCLETLLIKTKEQKRGLMQKLLTGKWSVKVKEVA